MLTRLLKAQVLCNESVPPAIAERIVLYTFFILLLGLFLPCGNTYAQYQPVETDSILIDDISFEGHSAFSSSDLNNLILTRESPAGFWVFMYDNIYEGIGVEQQFFDYPTYEEDAEALWLFYRNNGYFSAVVNKSFSYVDDSTAVKVKFQIEEGKASYVDSINYRRLEELTPEVRVLIDQGRHLEKGKRYNADVLELEKQRIVRILHNNGYPRAFSDSINVERKLSTNNVTIKLPFYYGKQLYFGRITDSIQGEDGLNLAREVIYKRLEFDEGDVYSVSKRSAGESALIRYGIFQSVKLRAAIPGIDDTVTTSVPVNILLTPRKMFELSPSFAHQYKQNRLYAGPDVTFMWRNSFGGAQTLTLYSAVLTNYPIGKKWFEATQVTARADLDQPYLFDNYTSGNLTVGYTRADEENLFLGELLQLIPAVRRRFSQNIFGKLELTIEKLLYENIGGSGNDSSGTIIDESINRNSPFFGLREINYFNAILTSNMEFMYTNDIFNPSAGYAVRATFEEAGFVGLFPKVVSDPFNSTEYHKLELFARTYTDLSKNRTALLGFKLKAGSIFRYGDTKSQNIPVPFNRRYYAGGGTSVRGWYARKLAADSENIDFGSHVLAEASVEFRWRLFPNARKMILPFENLWMTYFVDAGNVWNEMASVETRDIAIAAGFGVGYMTPFGPIRVEYGHKMYDPLRIENKWVSDNVLKLKDGAFHLGLGWSF
jgi:outer membrane protein assembly factor BamA